MDKEMMKFWLTCPFCKKKFGVYPDIVIKYMDRLFGSLGEGIKKQFEGKVRKTEKEGA